MLYTLPEKIREIDKNGVFETVNLYGAGFNEAIKVAKPVDPTKIRFRAKRIDNGEEIVGWLYNAKYIIALGTLVFEIDPSTLTVEVKE